MTTTGQAARPIDPTGDTCSSPAHVPVGGLRVGTDVAAIDRFWSWWTSNNPVLRRLFTADELAYAAGRTEPAATLAGMWALKEAWAKAGSWPVRSHHPHRIEVGHDPCGAPYLRVDGVRVEASVSVSHDGPVAMAVVLLAGT